MKSYYTKIDKYKKSLTTKVTKKRARGFLLELSVRGRLPTLPLSQYHRRGEA